MAPSKCLLAVFVSFALIAAAPQPTAMRIPSSFPFQPVFSAPAPAPSALPPPLSKPQPKECLSSLMKLMPCNDFLHNYSLPKPTNPGKCCDGIRSLHEDTPICFCHYYPDVLSKLMPPQVAGPVPPLTIPASTPESAPSASPALPPAPSKPQPKECLSSLVKLMPCNDFLHNYSLPKPTNPGKCCDGIRSLHEDAPICFCHYYRDVLSKLMPPQVAGMSYAGLPYFCNVDITDIYCNGPVPPLTIQAPTPESAPSASPALPPAPSKPRPKECQSSLMKLMPCNDFLHNYSLPKPTNSSKCCDGLRSINDDTPICLCHYYPDVLSNLMPPKVAGMSYASLPELCNVEIDVSCNGPVPPLTIVAPTPGAASYLLG